MKIARFLLGLFLVFVALVPAHADDFGFSEDFQKYVDEGSMPGAVAIVATPTEILASDSVGWADVAAKRPMDENVQFWIASNTKAVVAVAVMICVDEGLLDLDVPVENYLPQLKNLRVGREQEEANVASGAQPHCRTSFYYRISGTVWN